MSSLKQESLMSSVKQESPVSLVKQGNPRDSKQTEVPNKHCDSQQT